MAAYRDSKAREAEKPCVPFRILTLDPSAFAVGWSGRPKAPTRVGLRLLAATEELAAREWADKQAEKSEAQRPELMVQAYNEALMVGLVSRSLCAPEDARKTTQVFPIPDESIVGNALTSAALKWLFEELERAAIAAGPAHAELDDEGIARLGSRLAEDDPLAGLDAADVALVRRLLAEVADILGAPDA